MQRQVLFILLSSILLSCNSKKNTLPEAPQEEVKKAFIPVTQIILGQLNELDSMPVTPLKLITLNGKTDSIWILKEEIRKWVAPFLTPVIDSNLQKLFNQKSFLDQTINAFTFSYDPSGPIPDSMQLHRWDVYVDPQKQTVKRIYMVKEVNIDGKILTIQLTWKTGSWAQITTIPDGTNDPKVVKEEKLIWNL